MVEGGVGEDELLGGVGVDEAAPGGGGGSGPFGGGGVALEVGGAAVFAPEEDVDFSGGVDGHGSSVLVAFSGGDGPDADAGGVGGDGVFSALGDEFAVVVSPGGAVVIAVGVAEVVAGFGVGGVAPAPGEVGAAFVDEETEGVGVDGAVAAGPLAVDDLAIGLGVDDPLAGLVGEEVGVGAAGSAAESEVEEEAGAIGSEGGVGDGSELGAAEVVLYGAEEIGAPGVGFGILGDGELAGAVAEGGEVVIEGEVDDAIRRDAHGDLFMAVAETLGDFSAFAAVA